MPQSPFKTREFQKLFKEWNQKLADDGFEDAEDFSLPDPPLKCWHSFRFKGTKDRFGNDNRYRYDYYSLAAGLLHNGFVFESDLSRRAWELHSSGKSIRQIEHILGHQLLGYKGKRRDRIHNLIFEIQRRSGIKR